MNERAAKMQRVAQILENDNHELGKMMTSEMGKPIKAAIAEAEKCAWVCRYYAENANHHLADQVVETNAEAVEGADLVIVSVPVGACGAVAKEIGPHLKPGAITVEVLPKKLDEEVAAHMVGGFGGVITKMNVEQAQYIGVKVEGPFKPDSYKY